ncbi:hypothetical protein TNCV_2070461 [Trichonephila clavipes]|uniref:Uncharacterized protein n=1 Tax=Trichonephila clavipes TaxID=2585209 RepID=A0A8X6W3Y6_TRICX|nr:hypothetical protein TNCV_2070461 [Trichonephila clavipes]
MYLQVDDQCIPGIALQQFQVKKTRPSSYGVLPSPAELGYERTEVVFSSFSDELSRDLKSVQVLKQLSCRAERLETEQRQKLEQQERLSIEKLRLEMELSRIANQSANQNNGQTSRVKSLDEVVKMVRLLTVKVPNKSDGWEYFFSSLEKGFR